MDFKPAIGASVDKVVDARPDDPAAPSFDYGEGFPQPRTVLIDVQGKQSDEWRETIQAELSIGGWSVCLTNLIAIPQRSIRSDVEGSSVFDVDAFLAEILNNSQEGKVIAALIPATRLHLQAAEPLRTWLAKAHRVEWIIYLGGEVAKLLGAPPQFALALVVIRSGRAVGDAIPVVRLVDLTAVPQGDWSPILRAAAKRGGGEVGSSIVLRNLRLDGGPWTYQKFSKHFADIRADAEQLGKLCRLGDLAEPVRAGLHRTVEAHRIVELGDTGLAPSGAVACFGGRSIGPEGRLLSPVCAVLREGLPDDFLLRPGDVLVRSIISPTSNRLVLAAVASEEALPATFDRTCMRIRWRDNVPQHARSLLVDYLNSTHARSWLTAHGAHLTLSASMLENLEVPDPSQEVVRAFEVLADAEQQYRAWANDVAAARRGLFTETPLAARLPVLLSRQRIEVERLRAARDAESIDYQIRNYYPHPIALRRELILQSEPGKPKIEAILDCAEHLLTLLAVIAILQEASMSTEPGPVKTRMLSFVRDNSLHLDWGKCFGLLKEGVNATARDANPLALRFPELAELATPMADDASEWSNAERKLRDWRNRFAHLQLLPDPELTRLSDELLADLNCILKSASFISTLPLVHVVDYELDPVSGERFATFQRLEGISPVFQRSKRPVPVEVPRGAVGFLTQRGDFISAFPWLTMSLCPMCKRSELFVFNRYERKMVTSIAMETGHPQENPALVKSIAAAIGTQRPA
jgi:hypothetical protein